MTATSKSTSADVPLRTGGGDASFLSIRGLTKQFPVRGAGKDELVTVLSGISLEVSRGEFTTVIGPSGCGKSTLLDCVAGLTPYDSGEIVLGGRRVTGPSPDKVVVFQQASLFPWRSVERNVAFGAEIARWGKTERIRRVAEALEIVGLSGCETKYPHELSGGMQQRVNLARALVMHADLILMDEPFGALDAMTKSAMQDQLLSIHGHLNKTIMFITHDIDEAVYLGDRVVTLKAGPSRIDAHWRVPFERPRDRSVIDSPEFREVAAELRRSLGEP